MHRTAAILIMLIAMLSCSSESKRDTPAAAVPAGPPETGEPAMHAVQNDRLQSVMRQINNLVYGQLGNEINLSRERQTKSAEIAKIAGELAQSQKAIIETLPSLKLKPEEESAFIALAEKLRNGAERLGESADQNQLQSVPAQLDNITNTCISCHTLFRKSRNLLEKCKDPKYTC